jgi:hypothetical protein
VQSRQGCKEDTDELRLCRYARKKKPRYVSNKNCLANRFRFYMTEVTDFAKLRLSYMQVFVVSMNNPRKVL